MNIPVQISASKKSKPEFSQAGFGQYFSDHMFIAEFDGKNWINPRIIPYQNLALDPAAAVLHYGQALFEGMKAFRQKNGKIVLFRPSVNWERMLQGANRLCMTSVPQDLFVEGIKQLVAVDESWVPSDVGQALYIRPTLIGNEPFLGVKPSSKYIFYVILSPVASYYKEGLSPLSIWVEEHQVRAAPGGLGAVKAGANYAASLQAAKQARDRGHAQVLWLDVSHKYVEEVGTMNVFFIIENAGKMEAITPLLDGTILPGNTRSSVIQLLRDLGILCSERKIAVQEIHDWHQTGKLKEAFGTGTAALISPMGQLTFESKVILINNKKIGAVSQKLYDQLSGIQHGLIEDRHQWLVPVN